MEAWQAASEALHARCAVEDRAHIGANRVHKALLSALSTCGGLCKARTIHPQAVRRASWVGPLHGAQEPGDERMDLLLLIPSHIDAQRLIELQFLGMPSTIRQVGLGIQALDLADDVSNFLPRPDNFPALHHAQGHLHVRLVLRIRVILRVLCETFCDDVLLDGHRRIIHFFALLRQEAVDPLHNFLLALAAQHPREDLIAHPPRQRAPIAADNVEALDFPLELFLLPINHLQSSVLLLFQEHQTTEDRIDLYLQALVPLVDRPLDLLGNHHGLLIVACARVHEHRVRVAIDHVELKLLLYHVNGRLQGLAPLRCDEGGQGLGVEAAVLEAQAPVHGVRCQLQSLLPNLKHLQPLRIPLRLDGCLHGLAALDKTTEDLRQDTLLHGPIGGCSFCE
mmetsp:Transcript_79248/g.169789  ORF Transcript_79248/g.169789 Transcript_79248/m.169789 type:complete len:395 (-) Transcript_79248:2743-3927(-)